MRHDYGETIVDREAGAGAGMLVGIILAVLIVGVILWMLFGGAGVPRATDTPANPGTTTTLPSQNTDPAGGGSTPGNGQ